MQDTMEFMYKCKYKYYPFQHYKNLKLAGYDDRKAFKVIQDGIDRIWNMIRNCNSEGLHPHEHEENDELELLYSGDVLEPVPHEWK